GHSQWGKCTPGACHCQYHRIYFFQIWAIRNPPVKEISSPYLVGYARVSTAEQSLEMQIEALRKAGVKEDNIHVEKKSGASKNRPALENALKDLRAGDELVVWKLDRLSRNPRE